MCVAFILADFFGNVAAMSILVIGILNPFRDANHERLTISNAYERG